MWKDDPINAIRQNAVTFHHVLVLDTGSTTRAASSPPLKRRQHQSLHLIWLGDAARKGTSNSFILLVQVDEKYRVPGKALRDDPFGLILLASPRVLVTIVHEYFEVILLLLKLCGKVELNPGPRKQPYDDVLQNILEGQKEITETSQKIKASQRLRTGLGLMVKRASHKVYRCASNLNLIYSNCHKP